MKERPMLFSDTMVRAILEGRKTQTRRVVKPYIPAPSSRQVPADVVVRDDGFTHRTASPYGQPGERLWVREAWRTVAEADNHAPRDLSAAHRFWYEADAPHQPGHGKLRPSIHMPRLASRINLEITGVRVERLHEISEADCRAEGLGDTVDRARHWYRVLWEQINGHGSWDANPWVWVIEFNVVPTTLRVPDSVIEIDTTRLGAPKGMRP